MRESMKKDSGITLITLVITVIVLTILAGVAVGTLTGDEGSIKQANFSTFGAKIKEYQKLIQEYIVKTDLTDYENEKIMINAFSKGDMKAIIPKMNNEDAEKYVIENNELKYRQDKVTEEEKEWLTKLDITAY